MVGCSFIVVVGRRVVVVSRCFQCCVVLSFSLFSSLLFFVPISLLSAYHCHYCCRGHPSWLVFSSSSHLYCHCHPCCWHFHFVTVFLVVMLPSPSSIIVSIVVPLLSFWSPSSLSLLCLGHCCLLPLHLGHCHHCVLVVGTVVICCLSLLLLSPLTLPSLFLLFVLSFHVVIVVIFVVTVIDTVIVIVAAILIIGSSSILLLALAFFIFVVVL